MVDNFDYANVTWYVISDDNALKSKVQSTHTIVTFYDYLSITSFIL